MTSDPSELLPVNQSVFQAVTEANGSFEKLVVDLEALQQVSFFPTDKLVGWLAKSRAERGHLDGSKGTTLVYCNLNSLQ